MALATRKKVPQLIGETFQASRANVKKSFIILLFVLGPFLLLQAAAAYMQGRSLFVEETAQLNWAAQLNVVLQGEDNLVGEPAGVLGSVIEALSLLVYPFVYASLILFISGWRDGNKLEVKEARTQAMQKYGVSLGALFLFTVILTAVFLVFLVFLLIMPLYTGWMAEVVFAVFYFGFMGLFLSKISLFLGHIVLADTRQGLGFGESWELTRGKTGYVFGFFILLFLIGAGVTFLFQFIIGALLGNSVVGGLVVNFIGLFVTLFYVAGYTVLYREVTKPEPEHEYEEQPY
ncbi:hypothetical protein [Alkalicoccus saliphilus]|uniref:Glycerophosphoryl diester phosphodiesterase membrane domain-containing protein n=1 Tax=Alkalicoccus saliphilus TaxID=200989 RepID=A0A2T4U6L9_9BACI|nr:hypothetical protein [Alkalicoccus saliphilus]PTL39046.1 hypothetical protein C6Y45_07645 [Alkalicoccus saliphilus]